MAHDDRRWVKHYDELVDPDLPIPNITLVDLFEQTFREFPERAACHYMGAPRTSAEMDKDPG